MMKKRYMVGALIIFGNIQASDWEGHKLIQEGGSYIYARSLFKIGEIWSDTPWSDKKVVGLLDETGCSCNQWLLRYLEETYRFTAINTEEDERGVDVVALLLKASCQQNGEVLLRYIIDVLAYSYPLQKVLFCEDDEQRTILHKICAQGTFRAIVVFCTWCCRDAKITPEIVQELFLCPDSREKTPFDYVDENPQSPPFFRKELAGMVNKDRLPF